MDDVSPEAFTVFVADAERRLRHALTGALGTELGRDAAAEALVYGWEHWERVRHMDNPVGYLYRVGLNWGRKRSGQARIALPSPQSTETIWIEPGLAGALADLSEKQRTVVYLVHGHQWSLSEVADLLGISKGTAQKHMERAMTRLRRQLGVA